MQPRHPARPGTWKRKGSALTRLVCFVAVALAALAFAFAPVRAGDSTATDDARAQMAPFARWIGGEWHMQGTIHTFEWGLDRRSVRFQTWFEVAGERTHVAEGVWFWHPGERSIRGYFTAVDSPADFVEATTLLTVDRMVSDLLAHTADGGRTQQRETWEFDGDDRCEWALFVRHDDHFEKAQGGVFERRRAP
jgi:hypothetical protein